ncbi:MAG: DEAD/DEAH box helicase, partial [Bacteroidia bacterium]|nr:DEAD/DEAH box helicase [Bacteroidia bacterium]MDW8333498.1 DEAD/DEAH box helicase [Bacteroidia bacterium]
MNDISQQTFVDPIGAFLNMRDIYWRHYNTLSYVYDSRKEQKSNQNAEGDPGEDFDQSSYFILNEREKLIKRDGLSYRFPWLELMPEYASSGVYAKDLDDELKSLIPDDAARKAFAEFAGFGFNFDRYPLYDHQLEALKNALAGKHVVVTSGTGSGKTESFLLPLFAQIISEAVAEWPDCPSSPAEETPRWDLVLNSDTSGKKNSSIFAAVVDPETGGLRQEYLQRRAEKRPAAVRAMILYPMNALVEDQMTRLRRALCSEESEKWFKKHLRGNRIYLGRYNGATPEAGYLVEEDGKPDEGKIKQLADKLKKIEERQDQIRKKIKHLR